MLTWMFKPFAFVPQEKVTQSTRNWNCKFSHSRSKLWWAYIISKWSWFITLPAHRRLVPASLHIKRIVTAEETNCFLLIWVCGSWQIQMFGCAMANVKRCLGYQVSQSEESPKKVRPRSLQILRIKPEGGHTVAFPGTHVFISRDVCDINSGFVVH